MGVLEFLEQTALSTFIRESSSLLAFPTFLCIHTLGLSMVAGINSIVAIRVLGLAPGIPLEPLRKLFPFMWIGVILSIISGGGLAMAKATTLMLNPILDVKVVLIVIAVIIFWMMDKKIFQNLNVLKEDPKAGKAMAMALLVLWTLVMIAGRLIAYSSTIFNYQ